MYNTLLSSQDMKMSKRIKKKWGKERVLNGNQRLLKVKVGRSQRVGLISIERHGQENEYK